MVRLAAIYTRISKDDVGAQSSTARQERLCRAWVSEQGWKTAHVYEDIDRSAHAPGVVRDEYENLLVEVNARRIDVVVCWRLDRLARSPGEFERFWSACQHAGVEIASATEPVDSTTPVGVALVRMLVTFAGLESDVKGIRLKARFRELAEQGVPRSGPGVYGYTATRTEIIEPEAVLIREAANRVLDGEGCAAIARSWAQRGVTARSGKPWSASGIRQMLQTRTICGDSTYLGELVAEGSWPAILDPLIGAQVRAKLVSHAGSVQAGNRDHLLRGLVRCGICGEKLTIRRRYGVPYFCCTIGRGSGCRRVSILQDLTETWVTTTVLARIGARRSGNHQVRGRSRDPAVAVRALDAQTDALHELNCCYFARGELTHAEWIRARDAIVLTCHLELGRAIPQPHPRGLPPRVPIWRAAEVWDELPVAARRGVLQVELAWINVHPPSMTGVWCSERLEPLWVQPDPVGDTTPHPVRTHHDKRLEPQPGSGQWPTRVVPSVEELRSGGRPLTVGEACRVTGMATSTIDEARNRGKLDGELTNGMWCYQIEALDRWRREARQRTPNTKRDRA